jgi:hypothetical protein
MSVSGNGLTGQGSFKREDLLNDASDLQTEIPHTGSQFP